jgi:hypothetical protein
VGLKWEEPARRGQPAPWWRPSLRRRQADACDRFGAAALHDVCYWSADADTVQARPSGLAELSLVIINHTLSCHNGRPTRTRSRRCWMAAPPRRHPPRPPTRPHSTA